MLNINVLTVTDQQDCYSAYLLPCMDLPRKVKNSQFRFEGEVVAQKRMWHTLVFLEVVELRLEGERHLGEEEELHLEELTLARYS